MVPVLATTFHYNWRIVSSQSRRPQPLAQDSVADCAGPSGTLSALREARFNGRGNGSPLEGIPVGTYNPDCVP